MSKPSTKTFPKRLTLAAHAAFVPTGIVTVLLGPLLPSLIARWTLNDSQAGYLFTAQFASSTLGVALSGIMVTRFGFRLPMVVGLMVAAAGVAGIPLSTFGFGLACVGLYGFGQGLSIPACNLSVAEENRERSGAALNLLNFSWSVGAVSCPFLLAAFTRAHHASLFLYSVAAVLFLVSLAILAIPVVETVSKRDKADLRWEALKTNRFLYLLGVVFFLYVGVENAVGGWLAAYAKRVTGTSGTSWVMTPSFYYAAMLLGRGAAPVLLRQMNEVNLARAGMMTSVAGMGLLLAAHSMGLVFVAAAITGLGLAAVYPITISMLSRKFGPAASRIGSVMFFIANLGGASIPWLVGFASTRSSSLRVGLSVPLLAALVILSAYLRDWQLAPAGQATNIDEI